jgi:hypothetical protein
MFLIADISLLVFATADPILPNPKIPIVVEHLNPIEDLDPPPLVTIS